MGLMEMLRNVGDQAGAPVADQMISEVPQRDPQAEQDLSTGMFNATELVQQNPKPAPAKKQGEFNLADYVAGTMNGKFVGLSDDGKPLFETPEHGTIAATPEEVIKAQGLDPAEWDISVNSKENAIPLSPLTFGQRAKMSFAQRPEDKATFLKQNFANVEQDIDKGFLVKSKSGVWQQVDPSFFEGADPWKLTKGLVKMGRGMLSNNLMGNTAEGAKEVSEAVGGVVKAGARTLADPTRRKDIVGDIAEAGPALISGAMESAGAAIGGMAGAAATENPAGAVAGEYTGAAIGAGLGGRVVTRIGKALGVDNTTPEQEAKETAIDMLFSLGGRAVAAGARPMLQDLNAAAREVGTKAAEPVKDFFASFFGTTTKAGVPAARTLINNNVEYAARFNDITKAVGGNSDQIVQEATKRNIKLGTQLVEDANESLVNRYGQSLENLATQAQGKMKVNPSDVAQNTFRSLEEQGIGAFRDATDLGAPPTLAKRGVFKFLNVNEAAQRSQTGGAAEYLSDEAQKKLQPLVNLVTAFGNTKKLEGSGAAKALKGFEKTLNNLSDSIFTGDDEQLKRVAAKMLGSFRTSVGQEFEVAGLAKEYSQLAKIYTENKDAITWGKQMINRVGGAESLVNDLVNMSGKRVEAQGLAENLTRVIGKKGEELYKEIQLNHAVKQFAPWWKGSLYSSGAIGIGAAAKMTGATGGTAAAIGAPVIAQTMPRVVSAEVGAARRVMSTLQTLNKSAVDTLLGNDQAFKAAFGTILQAPQIQQSTEQHLMQQIGMK